MSFDAAATTYERGRPPYPAAVFELLTERCGLRAGTRVLEIGAGNGLATGPLLAAGAHVVAVEPGEGLAAILADKYSEFVGHAADADLAGPAGSADIADRTSTPDPASSADPAEGRLEIQVSDFETASLPGDFDLAVAATALHWLDPGTSTEKIAHLVRPAGWLAAWWNEFGPVDRTTEFRDRLDEVYHDLLPHEPSYRVGHSYVLDTDRWRKQLTAGGYFEDVQVDIIEWQQTLTPQTARDLWSTFPNVAELPPPAHAEFLDRLGSIIDEFGGQVDDPRSTVVYSARRTG